jgi:hypothetical protein
MRFKISSENNNWKIEKRFRRGEYHEEIFGPDNELVAFVKRVNACLLKCTKV